MRPVSGARLARLAVLASIFLAALAASPLGAACNCTISASPAPPVVHLSGSNSGQCAWRMETHLGVVDGPGNGGGSRFCDGASTCNHTLAASSACLRTGNHIAEIICVCGKTAVPPGGGEPGCEGDTGSGQDTFFVNTTPTVGVSYSGPDPLGNGTANVTFSFPNTPGGDTRALQLFVDGTPSWGHEPVQESGTWSPELDSACWREGSHEIKAVAVACEQPADPAFRAEDTTSVTVGTKPEVGISVSGPDDSGEVTLTIPFNFENTPGGNTRVLRTFYDAEPSWGTEPVEVSGTWSPLSRNTACMAQGTHEAKVIATACQHFGDPDYQTEAVAPFQVDHTPEISVSLAPENPANPTGNQIATINYSFPQTLFFGHRKIQLWGFPSGTLLGSFQPQNREGTATTTLSCASGANSSLVVVARACDEIEDRAAVSLPACPKPPREDDCDKQCCLGPGGSVSPSGGGPAGPLKGGPPVFGPGARLTYLAGGAGSFGNPGQAAWNATLGRGWSHDYAERIVSVSATKAWLITKSASFRQFDDLNSDGVYEKVSPEDDYRTLTKLAAGWTLRDLDGTVTAFDAAGLWQSTTDRNGNAKTGTYTAGKLSAVSMPDGRSESFSYHPSGKLASITEIGVGGTVQRTWSYNWSGDDLVSVEAPDGTGQSFVYGDSRHPGYMTRHLHLGVDDGNPATPRPERVEGAWDYDAEGNIIRSWRGADDFASGVERHEFAYDSPIEPTQTMVTVHRSATEQDVIVYTLSRSAAFQGKRARVTSISGDCSSCGLAPNSQLFYDDPAHPLLPTRTIDGRGTETLLSYDAHGRVISRTEAAGTPLSRTTTWSYDPAFPELPTRIEAPSTSGGAAERTTVLDYDPEGNLTSRRLQGVEAGSFFDLETETTFNVAGQPLTVDPPGHGDDDETSYTYDPARGNLVADSRIDPLVGATTFEHDPFNRRTAVVDPNGVRAETAYDGLNRVVTVTRKGATTAEDLVTAYEYTALGDLLRTTLPRGNVIEYDYDTAGRLISIERKPDAISHGERTLYTLDLAGNWIKEELQRWNGSAWDTESFTDYVYVNRCQVGKVVHADSTATEYAYDCDGNLEKVWDANHPKSTSPDPTQLYDYDALDRMVSVTQPWTGAGGTTAETTYTYDVQDHLTEVTDAEGNTTTYTYSDRDLMTQEVSPVSGTMTHDYDEHGELVSETDARGITMTRTLDVLDRVTLVDYADNSLDTAYTYDDPAVPFSKGRLTQIAKGGAEIDYAHDRFGRVTQDGALSYQYDENGNRTRIDYPGGVSALYTHDFADREETLSYDPGTGILPLVTASGYKAFGPLTSLSFANGLSETRLYDTRYFPDRIQAGSLLDWDYAEDAVGNPTQITGTILGQPYVASFAYQDPQYYLTQGDGPWGARTWTYDRIGNRLTHLETGEPLHTYSYASPGHNPKLTQITPAPGHNAGTLQFGYDAAGNQNSLQENDGEGGIETTFHDYSQESRLSVLRPTTAPGRTDMLYDGRGFLRDANLTFSGSPEFIKVTPVYASEGLLMARTEERAWNGSSVGPDDDDSVFVVNDEETTHLFYFAGRPVAQLTTGEGLLYLTTDHLGTPVLGTNASGTALWAGGLEPFGRVWTAASDNPDPEPSLAPVFDASQTKALPRFSSERVFLRYPGQWASDAFRVGGVRVEMYQNVHRWYEPAVGQYSQDDPLIRQMALDHYRYASNNPLRYFDQFGLFSVDSSCNCLNPIAARDQRILATLIVIEAGRFCGEQLNNIPDINLRDCIRQSCIEGVVDCAEGGDGLCDDPAVLAESRAGWALEHWFRRVGLKPPLRRATVCASNPANFGGYAGAAVIHEWAHGCGYNPDGNPIPGIPGAH